MGNDGGGGGEVEAIERAIAKREREQLNRLRAQHAKRTNVEHEDDEAFAALLMDRAKSPRRRRSSHDAADERGLRALAVTKKTRQKKNHRFEDEDEDDEDGIILDLGKYKDILSDDFDDDDEVNVRDISRQRRPSSKDRRNHGRAENEAEALPRRYSHKKDDADMIERAILDSMYD